MNAVWLWFVNSCAGDCKDITHALSLIRVTYRSPSSRLVRATQNCWYEEVDCNRKNISKFKLFWCIRLAKTGHAPHSSKNKCVVLCIVCFVSFFVLFVCKCVLYYCHRVVTQLQFNKYISYIKVLNNLVTKHSPLYRWVIKVCMVGENHGSVICGRRTLARFAVEVTAWNQFPQEHTWLLSSSCPIYFKSLELN
jgi:hypothetical protein